MSENVASLTAARVLRAGEGETAPAVAPVRDRFLLDGQESGGRFSLVQHLFEPHALAGPVHCLSREDEFTYVLSGQIGAIVGGEEIVAGAGDLIVKPRGHWHTFWNAGDEPASVLEIISPGGLENLFREMDYLSYEPSPEALSALVATFGCEIDWEATKRLIERYGLVF